jgi:hypothetical protein
VGHDRVRGTTATHERFTVDPLRPTSTTEAGQETDLSGAPTSTDVWIDSDGRLRRLRIGGSPSIDMELWGYGTAVHVDPPPADQVLDATTSDGMTVGLEALSGLLGSGSTGPSTQDAPEMKISGPWKQVTSGTWHEVRWSVWQAPAGNLTCTTFEASPPPGPTPKLPAQLAAAVPSHEGVIADCSDPAVVDDPVPSLTLGTADVAAPAYRTVAGRAPAGATGITVVTKDGARSDVPVETTSRVFVWFGTASQVPAALDVAGAQPLHCTLDAESPTADIAECDPANP